MALFVITCRATGRKVSTGIRINGSTWNSGAEFCAFTRCPACDSYHKWCTKDVTLGDEAEVAHLIAVASKDLPEIAGVRLISGNATHGNRPPDLAFTASRTRLGAVDSQ